MFILLRRIERWLHQHIFKVGWLLTQNYQTTTIFYYTIFLPGVVLHELIYWLAAGMLNVRAERAIKWPEAQEVGELKLNFVRLNPKASAIRKAIISVAPLVLGLIAIWYIAHNIFDITSVFRRMSTGNLRDVGAAFEMLLDAPLFWLWIYVIFTIANTMYPSVPKDLQGWRSVLLGVGAVALALLVLGLGGEVFEALKSPVSELIFVLQATFVLMIAIDVLMVLVLGLIEYTIEHTTGNSATFRGGKMITVTREEALEEQRKQREQELKELAKKRNPAAESGIKSIYALAFSIPGIPPQEPLTFLKEHSQASIEMPAVVVPEEEKKPATMPLFGGVAASAGDEAKHLSEEQKAQRESIAARINIPDRLGAAKPIPAPTEKAEEAAASVVPEAKSSEIPPSAVPETKPNEAKPAIEVQAPAASVAPAKPEEKRQSSMFDSFGEADSAEKPAASRFGGFSKPALTTPAEEADEKAPESAEEKPIASRFGSFTKPALTTPAEEIEEADEAEEKPVASRFGSFSKPAETGDKTDDAEEKPVASRFSGFTKPALTDDKDDDSEDEEKPVVSRFGGFTKPALTTPSEEKDEKEPDAADEKPIASRFGGFTKPASIAPSEEKEQEEKPAASRFGGFSKPAVTMPAEEAGKEADESKEEKPVASRFGGFTKPAETGDKDEEKPVASRFGGFSKPAVTMPAEEADKEADESKEEKPVASRFGGFTKPALTMPVEETDEADEKPVASRFGGFGKPAETGDKAQDSEEEAKLATSRFSFSKPASQESSPSRFGASPFKPTGEDEKQEKPATASNRFASTEFRRIEADDEEDEAEKPSPRAGTSPFGRTSAFGASRPAPKIFGSSDEEDEAEEDDEEISRPSSPLLGRPSPFGAPRPAPKAFGSKGTEDDKAEDGEEEAPRSRVSGFGLGKRPPVDEIVYEDDEDDFRSYLDDDDEPVDSDDD